MGRRRGCHILYWGKIGESLEDDNAEVDLWEYLEDKIRNEYIWDKVEVSSMVNNMREATLRWFVHAKKRS
ncbi:hypothetical protein H5410_051619, partial [Solanum commersonii]